MFHVEHLLVAPCSQAAATHAVTRWHYSRTMPAGKLVRYGVWESDRYVGAVLFGWGASPYLGREYGLDQTQVCELVRVALRDHLTPVSQIVAVALRALSTANPGLRLVVSFADPVQGHHGGVYQAGNWIYTGQSKPTQEHYWRGKWYHRRTVADGHRGLNWQQFPTREVPGKHRYLMPLDRAMRRQIERLRQNYPSPLCRSS